MNMDARAEFERSLYEKQRQKKIIMDDIEGKQRAIVKLENIISELKTLLRHE